MVNHLGNWKNGELGDFVTLKRGFDLPQQKREDGQVPIFSSSGITGTHSTAMVKAPGVITGRYGTIGEVFYAAKDFWPLNITLTRDETENYLKIEDALSFDCNRYECTPEEVAERFADSPIVRLCNAIIPATLGQEDLEEVFTWARFFNETGISAKLMNHPLTKLCEKLFDEHRLMDFHRCVLDVDYRKLLLNELAHN